MALTTLQEINYAEKDWYCVPARVIAIDKTIAPNRLRLADFSGEIDIQFSPDYRGPALKPGLAVNAGLWHLPSALSGDHVSAGGVCPIRRYSLCRPRW